jgi:hypothetical protein
MFKKLICKLFDHKIGIRWGFSEFPRSYCKRCGKIEIRRANGIYEWKNEKT